MHSPPPHPLVATFGWALSHLPPPTRRNAAASDGIPDSCEEDCLEHLRDFDATPCATHNATAHVSAYADVAVWLHQCETINTPAPPLHPPPWDQPHPPPHPPSPPQPPLWPCELPWNQRERLEPPEGTGWRGSTLGTDKLELGGTFSDEQDPEEYEWEYGYPLHIYRGFYGRGNAHISDSQKAWIKDKGGILFYSVYKTYNDWANVGDPQYDWVIDSYIDVFNEVYPAKMWICLRYEPGLYTSSDDYNTTSDKYKGTVDDYKKMWHYIMDRFKAKGVTNAVWAMDFSTEANFEYMQPHMAALWPGDADHTIDWLLWNVFTYQESRGESWETLTGRGYDLFTNYSGVPQEYCDYTAESPSAKVCQNYTVDWNDHLWGIGAWGANAVKDWQMVDEGDRAKFLRDAADAFGSERFKRLRAHVYFDSYGTPADKASSSEIGNETARRSYSDPDSPNSNPYSDSGGGGSNRPVWYSYQKLLTSDYFTANDRPNICNPPPMIPPPATPSPPAAPPPPPVAPPPLPQQRAHEGEGTTYHLRERPPPSPLMRHESGK